MAQVHEEAAGRLFDAFARGDMESFFAGLDADVAWVGAREFPDVTEYSGHDGVRQALADWGEVWQEMAFDVSRIEDVGEERILATGHMRARAKETGLAFEAPFFAVLTMRDERATSVRFFLDGDEAHAAAGLA